MTSACCQALDRGAPSSGELGLPLPEVPSPLAKSEVTAPRVGECEVGNRSVDARIDRGRSPHLRLCRPTRCRSTRTRSSRSIPAQAPSPPARGVHDRRIPQSRVTEVTGLPFDVADHETGPASSSHCASCHACCQTPRSTRLSESSRLQGVAPLVSPYHRLTVASGCDGLFFHGLCSPSRSPTCRFCPISGKTRAAFAARAPDNQVHLHRLSPSCRQ